MKAFLDHDFLLKSETAKQLYHNYAASMPLVDYHCHISPKEIYEDRRFDDLAQVWLGGRNADGSYFGDHYKWRLMRACGIDEKYITGDADGAERIEKFAEALEMSIGNPMIHWCNLELRRFFGVTEMLTSKNAREIYAHCSKMLREDPDMSVRGLIRKSNVLFIGTTDDPTDSLEWHEKILGDASIKTMVCPSFRPDKAINIHKDGFVSYIKKLSACAGMEIGSAQDVCAALSIRLEAFAKLGCRASDHGLDTIPYCACTAGEADEIFVRAMNGEALCATDVEKYQTFILLHLGREYARLNIAMQLHYSCARNVNRHAFEIMGPDTGHDMIMQNDCAQGIAQFISRLEYEGKCPRSIFYSLNPSDNALLDSLIGCFYESGVPGKFQHGSAWWFNDTRHGMEEQIRSLASIGALGNFIGMLTDSRSFLSYPRHEYFRRILCNFIGTLVENGEFANDKRILRRIVEGICANNAIAYFNLPVHKQ